MTDESVLFIGILVFVVLAVVSASLAFWGLETLHDYMHRKD